MMLNGKSSVQTVYLIHYIYKIREGDQKDIPRPMNGTEWAGSFEIRLSMSFHRVLRRTM